MTNTLSREAEARVRESFARQGFMKTLGAELRALGHGYCELAVAFHESLTQQHGFIHAGVTATIADNACGYAAYTVMPANSTVLTTEFKVNMLSPAKGPVLVSKAHVIKPGRTLVIVECDVYNSSDDGETLVAKMLATALCLMDKKDAPTSA
jgi:uncharacterized protein (TIGR00369 family)